MFKNGFSKITIQPEGNSKKPASPYTISKGRDTPDFQRIALKKRLRQLFEDMPETPERFGQ